MAKNEDFIDGFRIDHRNLNNCINSLHRALKNSEMNEVKVILSEMKKTTEPHFKFEEDYLYPRLQRLMRETTQQLHNEHETILNFFDETIDILDKANPSGIKKETILNNLSRFSIMLEKCDDLSSFAEKFHQDEKEDLNRRYQECKTSGNGLVIKSRG